MEPKFKIPLANGYHLTEILMQDSASCVEHLQCKVISDNTMNIPFPYTKQNAEWWINEKLKETHSNLRPVTFAIRDEDGKLLGAVGLDGMVVGENFRAELGYWLSEKYWGKGIMTNAVKALCSHAFDDLGLEKITATVFVYNEGSRKVLEKNGFKQEGLLKKHVKKNGILVDTFAYALFKPNDQ